MGHSQKYLKLLSRIQYSDDKASQQLNGISSDGLDLDDCSW